MDSIERTIVSASDRLGRRLALVMLSGGQYAIACNGHPLPHCVWEVSEYNVEACARKLLELTEGDEARRRAAYSATHHN
jgi:hypothetical protein